MDSYLPKSPEEMFPRQEVGERQFRSWREHPVTSELVREVHRRIYELNIGALAQCQSVEELQHLRGQAAGYARILEWMFVTENESGTEAE